VTAPVLTLKLASLAETIVVSATKTDTALVDAPATMSVITNAELQSSPSQNYGDLLRRLPGVNVIQLSARDINITSRQATGSLANTQLVVLDGRSVYLDFFGIVLWDLMPTSLSDIKQIEVIRGPAAAVWGANALTGVVNIITKSPREAKGGEVTFTGGFMSRDAGSKAGQGAGGLGGVNASFADAPNDTWSYKVTAGYFKSAAFPRPSGSIPLITDPRDSTLKVGGAAYPADGRLLRFRPLLAAHRHDPAHRRPARARRDLRPAAAHFRDEPLRRRRPLSGGQGRDAGRFPERRH
jgi:outer membrane receptor protein involved in Fe transport